MVLSDGAICYTAMTEQVCSVTYCVVVPSSCGKRACAGCMLCNPHQWARLLHCCCCCCTARLSCAFSAPCTQNYELIDLHDWAVFAIAVKLYEPCSGTCIVVAACCYGFASGSKPVVRVYSIVSNEPGYNVEEHRLLQATRLPTNPGIPLICHDMLISNLSQERDSNGTYVPARWT